MRRFIVLHSDVAKLEAGGVVPLVGANMRLRNGDRLIATPYVGALDVVQARVIDVGCYVSSGQVLDHVFIERDD